VSEPSKIDEPNCNACGVAMDRNNRCDFEMPTPERWAQVCIGCIQLDRGDVVYRVRVARKAAEQETPMHEYKVGDRVEGHAQETFIGGDGIVATALMECNAGNHSIGIDDVCAWCRKSGKLIKAERQTVHEFAPGAIECSCCRKTREELLGAYEVQRIAASAPKPPEPTLADFEELVPPFLALPKGWRWVADRCGTRPFRDCDVSRVPHFVLTVLDENGREVLARDWSVARPFRNISSDLRDMATDCAIEYARRSHSGPGRGRRR
jgi:hypothetical protein